MNDIKDLKEYLQKHPDEIIKPTMIFDRWDVIVNGRPYVVGEFEGFVHTISYRGGAETYECLYCWPRDEQPAKDNIVAYRMHANGPVDWGIKYMPRNTIDYKHNEIRSTGIITITRNGKDFYEFVGSMHTGIDRARCIIERIIDGPIDYNAYDYVNKEILGHECYFYGYKAKIDYWCEGQGCVCLVCAEEDPERVKEAHAKWEAVGCEDCSPKINIVDPYPSTGFTWYDPERE